MTATAVLRAFPFGVPKSRPRQAQRSKSTEISAASKQTGGSVLAVSRAMLRDLGRDDTIVPESTLAALAAHSWPGNIRELKNVLACALAFVGSGVPEPRHLRFVAAPAEETVLDRLPLGGHALINLERAAIRQTLIAARGNKVQAAKVLGIAPSTLYEKLKKHSL